jgi:hypothetical protein
MLSAYVVMPVGLCRFSFGLPPTSATALLQALPDVLLVFLYGLAPGQGTTDWFRVCSRG